MGHVSEDGVGRGFNFITLSVFNSHLVVLVRLQVIDWKDSSLK